MGELLLSRKPYPAFGTGSAAVLRLLAAPCKEVEAGQNAHCSVQTVITGQTGGFVDSRRQALLKSGNDGFTKAAGFLLFVALRWQTMPLERGGRVDLVQAAVWGFIRAHEQWDRLSNAGAEPINQRQGCLSGAGDAVGANVQGLQADVLMGKMIRLASEELVACRLEQFTSTLLRQCVTQGAWPAQRCIDGHEKGAARIEQVNRLFRELGIASARFDGCQAPLSIDRHCGHRQPDILWVDRRIDTQHLDLTPNRRFTHRTATVSRRLLVPRPALVMPLASDNHNLQAGHFSAIALRRWLDLAGKPIGR